MAGKWFRSITRDRPRRRPLDPPPGGPADAFTGIAPDAELLSIRQSSQAFTLKDAYTGDEDPQTRQKRDNIFTMARAIVHAADMGAKVINISQVMCMSARSIIDAPDLGAAVRYAAVDKDAVIVAAAGDTSQRDCKENPMVDPLHPKDSRDWNGVTTVVTPSWFSDYVLTVGAVDSSGTPMDKLSVAGPWVGIGAPGTDVVGLSPRDDSLVNAIDGPDNSLLVPAGTSFSTAIVSGVAALVRAKYPQLSAHQVINRLQHTARAPARGVDNQIGYGVVDPVAALTWDVPDGSVLPKDSGAALTNASGAHPAQHDAGLGRRRWTGWRATHRRLGVRCSNADAKDRETVMKAQREYGLALSWPRVTVVFLIDVALLVIASHCPAALQAGHTAFWVGVGLAVIVTIVALVTNGGVPIASAPIARVRNWYADPEALTVGCTPAIDHRRQFSRETVGVREYDGQLIAVIAVDSAGEAAWRDGIVIGMRCRRACRSKRSSRRCASSTSAWTASTSSRWERARAAKASNRPSKTISALAAIGARSKSATPGWCCGWIRCTTSRQWPPAIPSPAPWRRLPSGWLMISTGEAARRGR